MFYNFFRLLLTKCRKNHRFINIDAYERAVLLPLSAWMSLRMDHFQSFGRDMSVDLRGRQDLVTEHLLNTAQICAASKNVARKRMPHRMRRQRGVKPRR